MSRTPVPAMQVSMTEQSPKPTPASVQPSKSTSFVLVGILLKVSDSIKYNMYVIDKIIMICDFYDLENGPRIKH